MTFELFLSAIPFYYIVCFVSCYFLPIEQMFLFFFTSYISLSMAQVHGYKTKVELWSISRRYVVDTICFCLIFIFIFLFFYFFFSLLVQHNYRKRKMENGRVI